MRYKGIRIEIHWKRPWFRIPTLRFSSNSPMACIYKVRSLPADNLSMAKPKVKGLFFEDCARIYAQAYFKDSIGVLLLNVNPSGKPPSFWSNVPPELRRELLKEIVLLSCSSLDEVFSLRQSLPMDFCHSIGYYYGEVVFENYQD